MCGCSGSTPQQQQARTIVHNGPRAAGGPGQPGYTWDGPAQPAEPKPQPAQPAQK